eukprot:TCONS_00057683-protein
MLKKKTSWSLTALVILNILCGHLKAKRQCGNITCISLNGFCIGNSKCECNYGWFGPTCEKPCQCNGLSPCDKDSGKCLQCVNHSEGENCQRCKPGYIGSPQHNQQCISCQEFCHGKSNICVTSNSYNFWKGIIENDNLRPYQVIKLLSDAMALNPSIPNEASCLYCKDGRYGHRCQLSCGKGYYRTKDKGCKRCSCNEHATQCDQGTGQGCRCLHNTLTKGTYQCLDHRTCLLLQCSYCRNGYIGSPTNGKQCYKKTNENFLYEDNLHLGNIKSYVLSYDQDQGIRLNVDVIEGAVDIYLTDNKHVFRATLNENGTQNLFYNDNEKPTPEYTTDEDISAVLLGNQLITFKRYQKGVLAMKNMQHRAIITIDPQDEHLRRVQFYVVIKKSDDSRPIAKTTLYYDQGILALDMKLLFVGLLMSALTLVVELTLVFRLRSEYMNNLNNELNNTHLKELENRPMLQYIFDAPPLSFQHERRDLRVLPVAVQQTAFDDDVAFFSVLVQLPGYQNSKCDITFGTGIFLLKSETKDSKRIETIKRTTTEEYDLEHINYGHNIA